MTPLSITEEELKEFLRHRTVTVCPPSNSPEIQARNEQPLVRRRVHIAGDRPASRSAPAAPPASAPAKAAGTPKPPRAPQIPRPTTVPRVTKPRRKPEKRAEIIAALEANPNAAQVARQVGGVSHGTVLNIAKAAGIDLAVGKAVRGGRQIAPEKRAEIIAALKANPNATQVARQIGGMRHGTVLNIAKAAGIDLAVGKAVRVARRLTPEKRAEIIAALKANPNATGIARQVGGVSHNTVWKIAKAAGIELHHGRPRRKVPNQPIVSRRARAVAPAVA